jgi:hypothetical protein
MVETHQVVSQSFFGPFFRIGQVAEYRHGDSFEKWVGMALPASMAIFTSGCYSLVIPRRELPKMEVKFYSGSLAPPLFVVCLISIK